MNTLIISIGGFIVLVGLIIALKAKTGNKFEVKNSDIVLALIPIALWLFLTGQVQELAFGDLKIVSAVKKASASPVEAQVTELPVESVQVDIKAGVREIPRLIEKKSEALSFRLGYGGYWGPAISEYLGALTREPYLRYIVISNPDGSFFGMADARRLAAILQGRKGESYARNFANMLASADRDGLKELPGFISTENTLKETSDKRTALKIMDSLDVQTLPVTDASGRFVGIVDRSKLTASILIDIADRLEHEKE